MIRYIGIIILLSALLRAEYIKEHEKYSQLSREKDSYMKLIEHSYKESLFSKEELQQALADENFHPLSDIVRALAYDEVSDSSSVEIYIENAMSNITLFKTDTRMTLAFCDVLLRIGKYDYILRILKPAEALLFPKKQKYLAYYYIGLAKYLKNENLPFSSEFLIIKYKFKVTQRIYTSYQEKLKKEEKK